MTVKILVSPKEILPQIKWNHRAIMTAQFEKGICSDLDVWSDGKLSLSFTDYTYEGDNVFLYEEQIMPVISKLLALMDSGIQPQEQDYTIKNSDYPNGYTVSAAKNAREEIHLVCGEGEAWDIDLIPFPAEHFGDLREWLVKVRSVVATMRNHQEYLR